VNYPAAELRYITPHPLPLPNGKRGRGYLAIVEKRKLLFFVCGDAVYKLLFFVCGDAVYKDY
jgi:hypothetical protein